MDFIAQLKSSDSSYLEEQTKIFNLEVADFVEKIRSSDFTCHKICRSLLVAKIEKRIEDKIAELKILDAKILEDKPSVFPSNLEISSELVVSRQREVTENLLQTIDEEFDAMNTTNLTKMERMSRSDDQNFLKTVSLSDQKFRVLLEAKISCPIIPFSECLRDGLVDDRDSHRNTTVNKYLWEKRLSSSQICEMNNEDNQHSLLTFDNYADDLLEAHLSV